MQLEKDKLYISFHKPRGVVGFLISAWTLGEYSHCEFVYNGNIYLANPGGVRDGKFKYKKNIDLFELDNNIWASDVIDFFNANKGKGYDYKAIVGSQFAWFLNAQDNEKFFCSEFCLNAIDYALQFTLTYKGQTLEKKGYHKFNPTRLFKYLKKIELIKEKEAL